MKYLFLVLISLGIGSAKAQYQKPQLLALSFSSLNSNLPLDSYCYLGTPVVTPKKRLLNCQREESYELMAWDESGKVSTLHTSKTYLSTPHYFDGTITWYEYDQENVTKIFQWKNEVKTEIDIKDHARSVVFLGDKWIFQSRYSLSVYKKGVGQAAQIDNIGYVFNPATSVTGDYAVKIRRESLNNSAPDEIWSYKNNKWIKVFGDRDSDPESKWLSFSNSIATGDGKVFVIAKDNKGEALVEISDEGLREVAREGVDVQSFESFAIAYNNNSVVFRAIDFSNRRVVYVASKNGLERVLTQGDTVLTPQGIVGVVDYPNPHSIIYNNPTIGSNGEVVIQATLLDFDDRKTLLGIGVISIKKDNL